MPKYSYSVRLYTTLPATRVRTLIISALSDKFDFFGWNPQDDDFINDKIKINIDDEESVIFWFLDMDEVDYDFIHDTVSPVTKALNISRDYDIICPKTGAELVRTDFKNANYENRSEQLDRFPYTIEIPLYDAFAYKRIALAINKPDAFPRKRLTQEDNNYSKYECEDYIIELDGDCAYFYFKEANFDLIASVMFPICDALMLRKGDFEINCDKYDYSIEHNLTYHIDNIYSIVFPLPSNNAYKLLNKHLHLNLASNNSFQIIDIGEKDDIIGWNLCGQYGYYDMSYIHENVDTIISSIKRALSIPADSIHIVSNIISVDSKEEDKHIKDDLLDKLENDIITPEEYARKKCDKQFTFRDYTLSQVDFLKTVCYYTSTYNQDTFSKTTQYKFLTAIFTFISNNVIEFYTSLHINKIDSMNKFLMNVIKMCNENETTCRNDLLKEERTVDISLPTNLLPILIDLRKKISNLNITF